ncbi:MAG: hypothetical protein ACO3ZD_09670, partial [Cyanobium sp.]
MARRLALFALVFALEGAGASAGAATLLPTGSAPLRWRVVDQGGEAPRTQVVPASRPPLAAADAAVPADAAVAAAPIRPAYLIRPSLGGGVPTGFVGGWGDYFLSASAGTAGNLRP